MPRLRTLRLGPRGPYPGITDGVYVDKTTVEQTFLKRSEYSRRTGTPVYVGEFGPLYSGDETTDAQRRQILSDQLDIYDEYSAGWALWTYKDVGRQGLVTLAPRSPYLERFGEFIAKKDRLAADQWGTDGEALRKSADRSKSSSLLRRPVSNPIRGAASTGYGHCCST